ncbi:MAG: hypothetical protein WB565_12350 [Acidimicrobiales bacterium]
MSHDQISGLLSVLGTIAIIVASFFQWVDATYDGTMKLRVWPKVLLVGVGAAQVAALAFLFF